MENRNRNRRHNFVTFAAILGIGLFAAPAWAGSASSDMNVSASVSANCTISAGALAFGAYDPVAANLAAALDGTATLTVRCTQGASATIALDQGANADAGSTALIPLRRMADGAAHFLAYFLFQDAGRSTVWGAGAAAAAYTGTGDSQGVTVYGRMPAAQNVPAGNFADTVSATINF